MSDLTDLIKFVDHTPKCDFIQPMWHKGPCDCGLHASLDAMSPAMVKLVMDHNPSLVIDWQNDVEHRARYAEAKRDAEADGH